MRINETQNAPEVPSPLTSAKACSVKFPDGTIIPVAFASWASRPEDDLQFVAVHCRVYGTYPRVGEYAVPTILHCSETGTPLLA